MLISCGRIGEISDMCVGLWTCCCCVGLSVRDGIIDQCLNPCCRSNRRLWWGFAEGISAAALHLTRNIPAKRGFFLFRYSLSQHLKVQPARKCNDALYLSISFPPSTRPPPVGAIFWVHSTFFLLIALDAYLLHDPVSFFPHSRVVRYMSCRNAARETCHHARTRFYSGPCEGWKVKVSF